jgi:hypothetical protein
MFSPNVLVYGVLFVDKLTRLYFSPYLLDITEAIPTAL